MNLGSADAHRSLCAHYMDSHEEEKHVGCSWREEKSDMLQRSLTEARQSWSGKGGKESSDEGCRAAGVVFRRCCSEYFVFLVVNQNLAMLLTFRRVVFQLVAHFFEVLSEIPPSILKCRIIGSGHGRAVSHRVRIEQPLFDPLLLESFIKGV